MRTIEQIKVEIEAIEVEIQVLRQQKTELINSKWTDATHDEIISLSEALNDKITDIRKLQDEIVAIRLDGVEVSNFWVKQFDDMAEAMGVTKEEVEEEIQVSDLQELIDSTGIVELTRVLNALEEEIENEEPEGIYDEEEEIQFDLKVARYEKLSAKHQQLTQQIIQEVLPAELIKSMPELYGFKVNSVKVIVAEFEYHHHLGMYDSLTDEVFVYINIIDSLPKVHYINTLVHEYRHAWQCRSGYDISDRSVEWGERAHERDAFEVSWDYIFGERNPSYFRTPTKHLPKK